MGQTVLQMMKKQVKKRGGKKAESKSFSFHFHIVIVKL